LLDNPKTIERLGLLSQPLFLFFLTFFVNNGRIELDY